MGKNTLVSIIVPVFNGIKFIDDAYRTILKQELESFEIIFIDNNSTDNSFKRIKNITAIDSRVRVFKEQKQGAGAARNKGIKAALGEYVYFFDVDDILLEGALLSLKKVLDNNSNIDSVFGKWIQVRERNLQDIKKSISETLELEFHAAPFYGIQWFTNLGLLYGTPSFMHRKVVFDKVGIFPDIITVGEDAAFHIKLGLECEIAYLDKYIYAYYRHQESTMGQSNKKYSKVELHWPQYTKFYIPYLFNKNPPISYHIILAKKVYISIIKLIHQKKKLDERKLLFKKLRSEIEPFKIPILTRIQMNMLVFLNNDFYFKFLLYYSIPYSLKLMRKWQ